MRRIYCPDMTAQQRQLEKKAWIYPVRLAMEATYYLQHGEDVIWSPVKERDLIFERMVTKDTGDVWIGSPQGIEITELPIPDRLFTKAFDKRYQAYGNYKYHPATHMQVADGCAHAKCSFCVENGKEYKVRRLEHVVKELEICHAMGFREIFDDSATFPTGEWRHSFCTELSLYHASWGLKVGCNMRVDPKATTACDMIRMSDAGFRMVLIGVESANQRTLDRIQKGINAEDIIPFFKRAADFGLEPHIAVMFGYPWESEEEERRTLELVHFLLRKGYAKTAQASIYAPGGKRAMDRGLRSQIYSVAKSPEFWIRKLSDIREWADFVYLLKGIKKGIGL